MNLNYESGKVGDYKGTPVYTIEEVKFEPKRANIYALGHQEESQDYCGLGFFSRKKEKIKG